MMHKGISANKENGSGIALSDRS